MVVEGWSYGLQQAMVVMVTVGWCSECVASGGGRGGGKKVTGWRQLVMVVVVMTAASY